MRTFLIFTVCFLCCISCKESISDTENKNQNTVRESLDTTTTSTENSTNSSNETLETVSIHEDTTTINDMFSAQGFNKKIYYELLIETHICNPQYSDTTSDGSTPCSARYFDFFPYNHNREINDAFMLQVKAGVNNYPYRRILIFVREKGELVLMNGIIGYLVKRVKRPNKIDDLIVGIVDDLGNDKFDRYDVLLHYNDGKYHFKEAIGDLKGKFETKELKEKASQMIKERMEKKKLLF